MLRSWPQIMGRKFDDHLMATLHSLLEKLGDTNGALLFPKSDVLTNQANRSRQPISLRDTTARVFPLYVTSYYWFNFLLLTLRVTGGYKSLPHLIAKNTDYLIDSISLRMKHLDLYPNTPQVFPPSGASSALLHSAESTRCSTPYWSMGS